MKIHKKILMFTLIALSPLAVYAAINSGTLDDRDSKNSYKEVRLSNKLYGRYQIEPAGDTIDGPNAGRIERYYNRLNRAAGKRFTFQATYRISRVSSDFTYIAQTHAANNDGSIKGPANLIRVERKGSNQFNLYREHVNTPGGKFSNGGRSKIFLGTVNKNTDFTLKIISGYNTANTGAFTTIFLNGARVSQKSQYLTDNMRFRYGAYSAKVSPATIYIRNTSYRTN